MSTIETGTASFAQVQQLLSWAAEEGWNPGMDDAAAFHGADPHGFFVALDHDQPVAGVSVVKQDVDHAFLGLYICLADYRGRGYGMAAWNAGLAYAHDCSIGLDGVPEQQPNYQRSGFEFQHRTLRYAGTVPDVPVRTASAVRMARTEDWPAIISLDGSIGGVHRESFYRSWLKTHPQRTSWVYQQNGTVSGFITLRRCMEGFKIGPLLAPDAEIAALLIDQVKPVSKDQQVLLDVPEPNAAANKLVGDMGWVPVFETARMYRGNAPQMQLAQLFGVATLELG